MYPNSGQFGTLVSIQGENLLDTNQIQLAGVNIFEFRFLNLNFCTANTCNVHAGLSLVSVTNGSVFISSNSGAITQVFSVWSYLIPGINT